MLREEKELREFCAMMFSDSADETKRDAKALIAALVRAVKERCANVATGKNDACGKCAEEIAAAIRKGK